MIIALVTMRDSAELLNAMLEAGVISTYALFDAIAQIRYTEPVATLDADILVILPDSDRLDVLRPIYDFCESRGFHAEGEAIRVGGWPAQFVPVFSNLTREAVEEADTVDFEGVPLRVVRAAHLAVIALGTGRGKDFARILSLLESDTVTREEIGRLSKKHGLENEWKRFETRFLDA